jgi:hypothetical protein
VSHYIIIYLFFVRTNRIAGPRIPILEGDSQFGRANLLVSHYVIIC